MISFTYLISHGDERKIVSCLDEINVECYIGVFGQRLLERHGAFETKGTPLSHKFERRYKLKAGFLMIADDRGSQIAESSAIVCDHMETHFCDRLRSCVRDRRRSHTIAEDRTMFYRLRSSAIVCDPAIIWKPKFCDLRSKCIP